jgi:CO/xanthine dehydrogenase Mo-binding subunit
VSSAPIPAALARHPRPAQWLGFGPDGTLWVKSGKVELGQGLHATLAAVVAEELDWPLERVRVAPLDTATHPDEGVTSGSLSVQDSGQALRVVAAAVRERLRAAAAARLGVATIDLRCRDGRLQSADGRCVDPPSLADEVLARPLDDADARPKRATQHRLLGRPLPRPELDAIFAGTAHFIHDLAPAGLLHGRVLHAPNRGDRPQDARAALAAARALPGVVDVRQDGALFGVLAARPAQAEAALATLRAGVAWTPAPAPEHDPADPLGLLAAPAETRVVAEHGSPGRASRRLRARYTKPWLAHASIGLACALARWSPEGRALEVWTHSQGPFNLRRDLALAFALPEPAVTVRHVPGAGCYGHNGADDVAFDAAWLARAVPGRPVRVLWSRADELARAPLGPAMVVELEAGLDDQGRIIDWTHELWSPGHSNRPGRSATPALLGNAERAHGAELPAAIDMPLAVGGGAERNAIPGYALPAWRVVAHRVASPWRSSALRSLGAYANVYAAESFIDEIARATGRDPLALRLEGLAHDPRGRAVLEAAARRAGWSTRRPFAEGVGHGLGYARYKNHGAWCAVVAEVQAGATLAVRRLTIAVDVGAALHPDGVVAQIEGGAIQATSWTLLEAVRSDPDAPGRVGCRSWEQYPILRFSDVPAIDVTVLPSSEPPLGAGEAALGPTAAAIANALADALGVRVRDLPLTPDRIVAAIDAADATDPAP